MSKLTLAQTICEATREHCLNRSGIVMGQCLDMAGNVAGTVPSLTREQGLIELSMADVMASGGAVGYALDGRPTIFVTRYQGFQAFNGAFFKNYAAKCKEIWGYNCPIFIRSIGMDGSGGITIGPVASCSQHGEFIRIPGMTVVAPVTPSEWLMCFDYWWLRNGGPVYCSEYRRCYPLTDDLPNIVEPNTDVTIFPISATRLDAIEARKKLKQEGIMCNIVNLIWLKPFVVDEIIKDSLSSSKYGGLVLDTDFENGASKCIAFDIMQKVDKKVHVLGLEERTAGFAKHLDNLPPTPEKIVSRVKEIISA